MQATSRRADVRSVSCCFRPSSTPCPCPVVAPDVFTNPLANPYKVRGPVDGLGDVDMTTAAITIGVLGAVAYLIFRKKKHRRK
jgi:hypothetical protein